MANNRVTDPDTLRSELFGALDELTTALESGDAEAYRGWAERWAGGIEGSFAKKLRTFRQRAAARADELVMRFREQSNLPDVVRLYRALRQFRDDRGACNPPAAILAGAPGTGFALRKAHLDATRSLRPDGFLAEAGSPWWITHDGGPMEVMGLPNPAEVVERFATLNRTAKREGLLALDEELDSLPPPVAFVVQLMVEGQGYETIDRLWSLRVDDIRAELDRIHSRWATATAMITQRELPQVVQEAGRHRWDTAEWNISRGGEPAVRPTEYSAQEQIGSVFAEIASIEQNDPRVGNSWDVHGLLTRDLSGWIRTVTRLLFTFWYQPDMLRSAIDLYFDRLRRELDVAAQLIREGCRLILHSQASEITVALSTMVPDGHELSPEESGHIREVLDRWENPELELRRFERLAFQAEAVRAAAVDWNQDRSGEVMGSLGDPERLEALLADIERQLRVDEDRARGYADSVFGVVSALLEEVDKRESELVSWYSRHTARPGNIRDLFDTSERSELIRRLIEVYRTHERPLEEYVRARMEARNAELRSLLEEYLGTGIEQRWSDEPAPSIESLYEADALQLALDLTSLEGEERGDLIAHWREADEEVGEALAARDLIFEDIAQLNDRSIQKVLREIDLDQLAKALSDAAPRVVKAVTRNMSRRAAALLREEMAYLDSAAGSNTARVEIAVVMRKLREMGELAARDSGPTEL